MVRNAKRNTTITLSRRRQSGGAPKVNVLQPGLPSRSQPRLRPPKYTLDELVAGHSADAPLGAEERAWMDASPAGREIW